MISPNWIAPLTFFAWPVIALWLYRTLPVGKATLWTILGAELLLPPGLNYKLPMVPQFDRETISSFVAFMGCLFVARQRVKIMSGLGVAELLILIVILSPIVTSVLNSDPVYARDIVLPGVGIYDGLSAALSQFLMLLPFFLGRQLFRSAEDNALVLRTFVTAMLLYSLPMLFELRMSPILNIWIYGYAPGEMQQAFRDGGYRPMVFIGHGLGTAFFTMMAVVAATAFWRARFRARWFSPVPITIYLGALLVLCKSAASIVYGGVAGFLILFTKPRLQIRVAMMITAIALLYPVLRTADLVPTQAILDSVASISADRAGSLQTRFDSEQLLLDRAHERFVFGWGRYGRNRNYGEGGGFTSTTDGYWIIVVGTFGLVGFGALFGLLALPVFRAAPALNVATSEKERIFLAALALIVAINIFDLLPNAGLVPWCWLLAGALLGRAEALKAAARQPRELRSAVMSSSSQSL